MREFSAKILTHSTFLKTSPKIAGKDFNILKISEHLIGIGQIS